MRTAAGSGSEASPVTVMKRLVVHTWTRASKAAQMMALKMQCRRPHCHSKWPRQALSMRYTCQCLPVIAHSQQLAQRLDSWCRQHQWRGPLWVSLGEMPCLQFRRRRHRRRGVVTLNINPLVQAHARVERRVDRGLAVAHSAARQDGTSFCEEGAVRDPPHLRHAAMAQALSLRGSLSANMMTWKGVRRPQSWRRRALHRHFPVRLRHKRGPACRQSHCRWLRACASCRQCLQA